MRTSNALLLRGRITRDITLEETQRGTSTCQFTVAVSRPRRKDVEEETDFILARAFGKTAEFISQYFAKGDMIGLTGELRVDQWTDQAGGKRSKTYMVVEHVEFGGAKRSAEGKETTAAPVRSATPPAISDDDDLPF